MCQLDVLQRLKCDRSIVTNTLKSLPKTLDETYERLFLSIPREEWPYVHCTLQWIHHHNELYDGQGIPCAILLDAIHSTVESVGNTKSDRFLDVDTLRELCGCLISVNEEDREFYGPTNEGWYPLTVFAVSIAHYTVLEYLESARISQGPSAHFAISTQAVGLELAERTLLHAQNLRLKEDWKTSQGLLEVNIQRGLMSDFALYCATSSILYVLLRDDDICASKRLFNLTKEFFHPLKPHFNDMALVKTTINRFTDTFDNASVYAKFFNVGSWPSQTAPDTHIFFCFLLLGVIEKEIPPLAKKMLEEGDVKDLLVSRLTLTVAAGPFRADTVPKGTPEVYEFEGTILELFAQFPGAWPFQPLLDYALEYVDPSRILILHMASHYHQDCNDACTLEKLLHTGANANIKGYRVMPLQIATLCLDFDGAKMLLEAGADPNNTGDANGVQWSATSILCRFNFLHKLSPLYICRNPESIIKLGQFKYPRIADDAPVLRNIESLLIQYGADEI